MLTVRVIQARKLKSQDWLSKNDPYVTLDLKGSSGPNGEQRRTATIDSGGTDCEWDNEVFQFTNECDASDGNLAMVIKCWDDDGSTSDLIGTAELSLRSIVSKRETMTVKRWYDLFGRRGTNHGALELEVTWDPSVASAPAPGLSSGGARGTPGFVRAAPEPAPGPSGGARGPPGFHLPLKGGGSLAADTPSLLAAPRDITVVAKAPAVGSGAVPLDACEMLELGLQWDLLSGQPAVDLDVACVVYDFHGTLADAAYYNNLSCCGGAVVHSGDCRTGARAGDDEALTIHLRALPKPVEYLAFVVTCHSEGTSLAPLASAKAQLRDVGPQGKRVLATISVPLDQTANKTALVLAILYRDLATSSWHLQEVACACDGHNFQDPHVQGVLEKQLMRLMPEDCLKDIIQLGHGGKAFDMRKGDDARLPNGCELVTVGLGWTARDGLDLDASVLVLRDVDGDGVQDVVGIADFRQLVFPGLGGRWAVQHTGDNRTGDGSGDDECIHIALNNFPHDIERLVIVVNIYTQGGSFRDVRDAYIRLVDDRPGECHDVELSRYKLDASIGGNNGLILAALHRIPPERGGGWSMLSVGEPANGRTAREAKFQQAVIQQSRHSASGRFPRAAALVPAAAVAVAPSHSGPPQGGFVGAGAACASILAVQCPAGMSPGQALQVQGPSGQMFQVAVPTGVGPGQTFHIQLAAPVVGSY